MMLLSNLKMNCESEYMIQCLRFESTVMIQIALNRIDCMLMSLDHDTII